MDLLNIFGSKPKVAKYKPVDLTKEQGKSLAGNIQNFGDIGKLGNLYSDYELAQLEKIIPGYGDSISAGHATTDAMFSAAMPLLHGEIPQDVQDQVMRSSAYQSLRGGYMGSGMSQALTARDLGLTSLDLMGKGASLAGQGTNSMQAWDTLARRDMLDPGSVLTTPGQQAAVTAHNNQMLHDVQQYQFNVDAAPDPVGKGIFDSTMQVIGMVLSAYGGGGGYKPTQSPGYTQGTFNQGAAYGNQGSDLYGYGGTII